MRMVTEGARKLGDVNACDGDCISAEHCQVKPSSRDVQCCGLPSSVGQLERDRVVAVSVFSHKQRLLM